MKVIIPYVVVVTAPAVYPVSLEEARKWCRVDDDDTAHDVVLNLLIGAATERAEEITGRAFIERQLELRLDEFPGHEIELPFPPIRSVQYVRYLDSAQAWQTLTGSPSEWHENLGDDFGIISPLNGSSWPGTYAASGAVRIGYTCGYAESGSPQGDDAAKRANVPALAKQWMSARIASFFENRESLIVGGAFQQPPRDFVDGLLDGLKVAKNFA